jgi:hypothetical protein
MTSDVMTSDVMTSREWLSCLLASQENSVAGLFQAVDMVLQDTGVTELVNVIST